MSRLIPTPLPPTVATFTVLSDGDVVPPRYHVLSILVEKGVNRIPSATLVLRDGDPAAQTFAVSESDYFLPGKKVEVKAGYQGTEESIFTGVVVSHGIKIREQRSVLQIVCKDESFKMTVAPQCAYFNEEKDSDILTSVIEKAGLQAEVTATSEVQQQVVQYNCTDWDFLLTRTDAIGKICLADNGKITITEPTISGDPELELEFGATILDFDAELDTRNQFTSITGQSWIPADQEWSTETAEDYNAPEASDLSPTDLADAHGVSDYPIRHGGTLTESERLAWTNARLQKSRLAKIRGRAKFQGLATILPNQLVKLNGLGARFNGLVYISAIRHEIGDGNWTTNVELGLDESWFAERFEISQVRNGGLIPPVSGLQIGTVTALAGDPDGEERIQVRLPLVDGQAEGCWARIANLDAGDSRGSYFRPEIDDEVVLGFLDNDPRQAIVLGGLYSSAKPAPITNTDENDEKGFFSREGMKLLFNDKNKDILLETPDGNAIELSGANQSVSITDQHGNKIVMDSAGIELQSSKDLTLTANAGNVNINGIAVKAEGQATAELSASGTTTIRGGLVQIN
ncbi:MAG: type VI secretion system tip protein VgrG [Bacteroidota bacterium]